MYLTTTTNEEPVEAFSLGYTRVSYDDYGNNVDDYLQIY